MRLKKGNRVRREGECGSRGDREDTGTRRGGEWEHRRLGGRAMLSDEVTKYGGVEVKTLDFRPWTLDKPGSGSFTGSFMNTLNLKLGTWNWFFKPFVKT